jgi:adenylate cyclase
MRAVKSFRGAGVSDEQILSAVRVLGRGMAQAAEALRSIGLELALEPGTGEADLARRLAERSSELVPMLGPVLEQMLRLHLRHAVGTEALGADERAAGALPAARDVGVAFADLVGFTALGEELPPAELGEVAEGPAALAADLVAPPVRLVKTIGDAAMLVSPMSTRSSPSRCGCTRRPRRATCRACGSGSPRGRRSRAGATGTGGR